MTFQKHRGTGFAGPLVLPPFEGGVARSAAGGYSEHAKIISRTRG